MSTLFTILAVLALVGSILITLVVLLQNSKGGGLASNFTAGNQTFGVRQTTDILEKITWGLAAFILVVSIAASFSTQKSSEISEMANEDVEAEAKEAAAAEAAAEDATIDLAKDVELDAVPSENAGE